MPQPAISADSILNKAKFLDRSKDEIEPEAAREVIKACASAAALPHKTDAPAPATPNTVAALAAISPAALPKTYADATNVSRTAAVVSAPLNGDPDRPPARSPIPHAGVGHPQVAPRQRAPRGIPQRPLRAHARHTELGPRPARRAARRAAALESEQAARDSSPTARCSHHRRECRAAARCAAAPAGGDIARGGPDGDNCGKRAQSQAPPG